MTQDEDEEVEDNEPLKRSVSLVFGRFSNVDVKEWSAGRIKVGRFITNGNFEVALAMMVVTSVGMIIVETDYSAEDKQAPGWVIAINSVLLPFYCLEMFLRCYVLRTVIFRSALDTVDFTVVVTDTVFAILRFVSVDLPPISYLRAIRLARLSRAFHILFSQNDLLFLSEAVCASLKHTFFGCMFMGLFLVVYSIIAVEFLHPFDGLEFSSTCSRCPHSFDSVYASLITFIQTVIVGDEWGVLFIPYMEEYPGTCVFILTVFVTVNFGLMNLIMAVIVDSAAVARFNNVKRLAQERERCFQRNQGKLQKLCESMDLDKSRSITVEELLKGYDSNIEFRNTLNAMDIGKEDMRAVFSILDQDGSGDVEYVEFVQQLHKMKSNNSNTMLVFIKHYVTELRKNVANDLMTMQHQIAAGIGLLHERVEEELQLIKDNMEVNVKALQAADKQLEATLKATVQKEDVIIQQERELMNEMKQERKESARFYGSRPILPSAPAPRTKAAPAFSSENVVVEGQLHIVSEKIAASLEDLRCKCESSAALMSTFRGLLPRACSDAASLSLRGVGPTGVANGGERYLATFDSRGNSRGFCQPRSCCAPEASILVSEQVRSMPAIPPVESSLHPGMRYKPP